MESKSETFFSVKIFKTLLFLSAFLALFLLLFSFFGENIRGDRLSKTTAADSFSRGAIGHHGFLELLRKMDVSVTRLRHTQALLESKIPIFFVSPNEKIPMASSVQDLASLLKKRSLDGYSSVLVLPKWNVLRAKKSSAEKAKLKELSSVQAFLNKMLPQLPNTLERGREFDFTYSFQQRNQKREIYATSLQTLSLTSSKISFLRPEKEHIPVNVLLGDKEKALLIETFLNQGQGKVYLLTDPDLLANFNFHQKDNSVAMIHFIRKELGLSSFLIDENFHGFFKKYSLFEEMKKFPLFFLTIHLLLLAFFTVWSGFKRFGTVEEIKRKEERGPWEIIDISTQILLHGQNASKLGSQYLSMLLENLKESSRLHPEESQSLLQLENDSKETILQMEKYAKEKGFPLSVSGVLEEVKNWEKVDASEKEVIEKANFLWKTVHSLRTKRGKQ